MKRLLSILITTCLPLVLPGQDITGQWNGELKIQEGMSLRIIFHIHQTEDGYQATLDSPDQNATGIPVTSVEFSNPDLTIVMEDLRAEYIGKFTNGGFTGTFTQAGQSFPLPLSRQEIQKKEVSRPQDPVKPYPYEALEVSFEGGAENVKLAGTLTLPDGEGPHPAVILISGSGPQNRDEELLNHKPFLVLADYLTRNGIAVLRYDDRGVAGSTGHFNDATSQDFADDAEAAFEYLMSRPETDHKKIGLVGHSEGGLIAPMVAANNDRVSFIVLLAGPGVPGKDILIQQSRAIQLSAGVPEAQVDEEVRMTSSIFDYIAEHKDDADLKSGLMEFMSEKITVEEVRGLPKDKFIEQQADQITSTWFRYFLFHDPAVPLGKVRCPVLAVNGEKDVQVIPGNLEDVQRALKAGGNEQVTIHEFPGLNHLFQECTSCAFSEYASIEQTFSPIALAYITEWIRDQTD